MAMQHRVALLMFAVALAGLGITSQAEERTVDVAAIARAFPDGGGYNKKWAGSGTPEEVRFGDTRILAKSTGGTYCCGFTFAVAMRAAGEAGLLSGKTVDQIKRFQKEWYGATGEPEATEQQCAVALERLGIGKRVGTDDAKAGDFLQFWRTKSGHSVVFLKWVEREGKRVGFTYRSSQGSTDGVGDQTEYFRNSGVEGGEVDPNRLYFGRLGTTR